MGWACRGGGVDYVEDWPEDAQAVAMFALKRLRIFSCWSWCERETRTHGIATASPQAGASANSATFARSDGAVSGAGRKPLL